MELGVLLILLAPLSTVNGLACFDCQDARNMSDCPGVVSCAPNSMCRTAILSTGGQTTFDLTCRPIQECLFGGGGLIGRRQASCSQCCSSNGCNGLLCNFATQVDGGWSSWESWSLCNSTCGMGSRSRARTCDYPPPMQGGKPCGGKALEESVCVPAFSNWSNWTACNATCQGGLQSRNRTCLTLTGKGCDGNHEEQRLCYAPECFGNEVAFSVVSPTGQLLDGVPIFSKSFTNTGSYNMKTGKFTCPVSGLYTFTISLEHDGGNLNGPFCHLRLNGNLQTKAEAPENRPYHMAAVSEVLRLTVGDVVDMKCNTTGWAHVSHGPSTSFSGVSF